MLFKEAKSTHLFKVLDKNSLFVVFYLTYKLRMKVKMDYSGIGMYRSLLDWRSVTSIYPAVCGGVTSAKKSRHKPSVKLLPDIKTGPK